MAPLLPVEQEALDLLEWPLLCSQVASFAATALARRAARSLPLASSQAESEYLLAQTAEAQALELTLPQGLPFAGVFDIGEALARVERQAVLSGEELLQIASTLAAMRQLRRLIDAAETAPTLQAIVADLRTYPELEQQIHFCIEDSGEVADRASDALLGIRQQQRQVRSQILDRLNRLLRNQSNLFQELVISRRSDRYVLPVKAGQKEAVPGIVHDSSSSGSTLYIEPRSVIELNNQLRQLQRREEVESEAVRRRLSEAIAAVSADLETLLAIATALDLAVARARYGLHLEANRPRFTRRDEPICLRQLRHPLLLWQQRQDPDRSVVPVNFQLQSSLKVVAITGPNTGGKTVTLKSLGLAGLMARAGLFVPAREPVELPWFERILTDIGDEQSLQQSLSTFSGHIRRIGRILEALPTAGASLVLLDEVGAGTDPSEGSALAIALLRYLADHATLTIATTHYGELKALKYQDDRFENASVEFDDRSLSPTYRLLWGIPGRSNALIIAERLGLSPAVVAEARSQLEGGRDRDVDAVIAGLEAQRRDQEEKAAAAAQLLRQTEKLHAELQAKTAELREREQSLRQQQEVAIQSEIEQARQRVAKVVRRLQQGPKSTKAERARQASETLKSLSQPTTTVVAPPPGFQPQLGDRLRIPRLGKVGEVLAIAPDRQELTVRCGILKLTVHYGDVESLQGEKVDLPPPPPKSTTPPPAPKDAPAIRTDRNTFDVRGSRVAEAEVVIEDALRQAIGPIWIIHGHGTGKLRHGVHQFLREHPLVAKFEAADQADGGNGVTVAYLKP
ncbi:endonuclease MutS2 [Synechococcus elongatus IITB4]|uniref:endonuclease MutS2 n=1 Tax=Synechococcus elongatus TaxID=32046 RepID=UPI0030D57631